MEQDKKNELALLLLLGLVGLKTAPYTKKYFEKFGITKSQYINLKKMNIYELLARYSFIDKIETMKGD